MPGQLDVITEYYRWITTAEHEDWKQTKMLRPAPGHTEGKYMTISVALAARWGQYFQEKGWESGTGHVLKIVFSSESARSIYFLGPMIDGIGPAYFAPIELLKCAKVSEVDL